MLCAQSCPTFCGSMDYSLPAPGPMEFSRQKYQCGLISSTPEEFPDSGIKSMSLMSLALVGRFFTTNATLEALIVTRSKSVRNSLHIMSLNIMGEQQSV